MSEITNYNDSDNWARKRVELKFCFEFQNNAAFTDLPDAESKAIQAQFYNSSRAQKRAKHYDEPHPQNRGS